MHELSKNDIAFAAAFISPIELFRTRMQAIQGSQGVPDVWRGIMQMIQREGPISLWRGLVPTMLRDVPFSAFYWMGYEKIKQYLNSKNSNQDTLSNFQSSFIAGASSGMVNISFSLFLLEKLSVVGGKLMCFFFF